MKKVILIGSAVILVAAAVIFFLLRSKGSESKFRTEKAMRGDVVMSVTAAGTVNAVKTVSVGTQVSGTIKEIYVDFNSRVKKEQLIALIDPAAFEAQTEQARASLQTAEANLEKAEAAKVDAKRTMDRDKELVSKGLIARSDFDTAETNYETSAAGVSAAAAQVAQAKAALKNAQTNLGYTRIVSPVDGTVVSRNVDIGQTVAASFQTPTLFSIAQDLTKMQIDTNVDEADIGKVKVGQGVDFNVDAYPETTFRGKVGQVRIAPITVQNVVTYDVVIFVDNPAGPNGDLPLLKPGMTANVRIIVSEKKDVLKIPNAALRFKPQEREKSRPQQKGFGVWALEDDKPRRRAVTLGISDGNYTEIIAGDLKEGQEVIVDSSEKPKGGPASAPRGGPRMF